jgi:hypothetical protein
MNFRLILREPALLLDTVETLLVLLVAFGIGLSGDQQSYIIAALVAAIAVAKAWATSPFPVTLITDLARAALVLAASFGLNITPDKTAVIVTFLGTFLTLIQRSQITPSYDPAGGAVGPMNVTVTTGNAASFNIPRGDKGAVSTRTLAVAALVVAVILALILLL